MPQVGARVALFIASLKVITTGSTGDTPEASSIGVADAIAGGVQSRANAGVTNQSWRPPSSITVAFSVTAAESWHGSVHRNPKTPTRLFWIGMSGPEPTR